MSAPEPYWYLASYPKSGNTWCRLFISELRRLAGLDPPAATEREDCRGWALATGTIMSSRHWLDDQLGIDTSDLHVAELDRVRGRVGHQRALYSETSRYHKVHDAFTSPDSAGRPVVPVDGCQGAVLLVRHPADVAVSLSAFFSWDLERGVAFLLDDQAALCPSRQRGGQQVRQFLGSWAGHGVSWLEQRRVPVSLLRYEDLLADPEGQFARLASVLRLPTEPALIAAAVARTRFERLRAREEEEGGFPERPAGCRRFFRSGRRGEGGESLSVDQWRRLDDRFAGTLQRLGYGEAAGVGLER
ncbi:MAG: sulfotransferase domain-containing protein [Cyanobacteriota bacterium]